ncbi:MAG: type II toxin-antitoxin system Phd/YefM family antitoxin [Pleurocapsa sp.]
MDTVTYTEFRKNLATHLNQIEADCTPLIVTRQNASSVVVMSLDDFKAYEATFHLLSSQNNAERLDKAIKNLREAKGTEHQLCEESEDSSKK